MDVSGHPNGARLALDLAGIGASVILPGLYGGQTEIPLLLDRAVFREIRLIGVFSHDFKAVEPAIEMAKRRKYPFTDMISHRFPRKRPNTPWRLWAGNLPGHPA